MVRKEYDKVNISTQSYVQLRHIAKVSNLTMVKTLELILESVFAVSINFDKCSLECTDSQLESTAYIHLHGYSKMRMGKFQMPIDATEEQFEEKQKEEIIKAFGES